MRFSEVLPAPTYPEYAELLAQAKRNASGPVDASTFPKKERIIRERGYDWCFAVLGKPCNGLGYISPADAELLVLADEAAINPPLPQWEIEDREKAAIAEEAKKERLAKRRKRDEEAWAAAREKSPVELEVRENTKTRSRYDVGRDSLRHATPVVDAVSGRRRQHPKGRALCETPTRSKPLQLSDPVDEPATCVRCLEYAPKIRAAEVTAGA